MAVDMTKVLMKDDRASLKVVDVITGSVTAPATSSTAQNENPHPHGLGSDNVIPVVTARNNTSGEYVTAPFSSPDGRVALRVSFDATNVYVTAISSTNGSATSAINFSYTLFIAVP